MMKRVTLMLLLCLSYTTSAEQQSSMKQQLDAAFDAARELKLEPVREAYIKECVSEWGRTQEYCTHF